MIICKLKFPEFLPCRFCWKQKQNCIFLRLQYFKVDHLDFRSFDNKKKHKCTLLQLVDGSLGFTPILCQLKTIRLLLCQTINNIFYNLVL